jgi:thioredoxin reductase
MSNLPPETKCKRVTLHLHFTPMLMGDGVTLTLAWSCNIISCMTMTTCLQSLSSTTSEAIDTVVVGGGIAGLSAALFLARAGRSVVVYDAGRSRILAVDHVREFVGFDGWKPDELLARAREEVLHYGGSVRHGTVEKVEPRNDGSFNVWVQDGMISTKTVILATGLVDELPALNGIQKIWGRDLRICPCFDGYEVRNQRFVVFGLSERLAHLGAWVSLWSPDVTVIAREPLAGTDAERLRLCGVRLIAAQVTGLVHKEDRLVAVSTESGGEIPCDVAWIAAPLRAASTLATSLCDVDEAGFAKTDENGRTSRPGVFAVGNATNPIAHLAHAAASGTNVGPWVTMYLLESRMGKVQAT